MHLYKNTLIVLLPNIENTYIIAINTKININ